MNAEILQQDIQTLLEFFSKNSYRAVSEQAISNEAMEKCSVLMKLDYNVSEVSNVLGDLAGHYPKTLLVPESPRFNGTTSLQQPTQLASNNRQPPIIYESTYDAIRLRDLFKKAKFARCRGRFPLPVILYRGKYICRSATLSGGPEIYTRSGIDYLFYGIDSVKSPTLDEEEAQEAQEHSIGDEQFEEKGSSDQWQLFDRVRQQDIKLLKTLNVGTIIDFMVEKKKVKFMMNVTSSEKVDKEKRYQDFNIIALPYPGCEFFREFRDNNYSGEGLVFDWNQKTVDADCHVPNESITQHMNINWDEYKNWDLVQITQNYMKLLLKYVQDSSSGLLIHCISGWDRTPLFISLLRLSMWADGVIHQTLNSNQILYFTIAYDWLLCGHHLVDRLEKGEEIFFFCFYVLKYLMDDEYSLVGQRFRSKHSSSGSSSIGVIRTDSDVFDGFIDIDSRGSSVSLNSTCSAKSQHDQVYSTFLLNDEHCTGLNGNNWINSHNDSTTSIECISNEGSQSQNVLNFSPKVQKRTSPISIGIPQSSAQSNSLNARQRKESSSSVSVGSWQMISGTGSLRSQDSHVIIHEHHHHQQSSTTHNNLNNNHPLNLNGTNHHGAMGSAAGSSASSNAAVNGSTETSTLIDDECFTASDYVLRRERLNAVRTNFYNCYSSTIGYKFRNGSDNATLGSLLGNFAEKVGLKTPV